MKRQSVRVIVASEYPDVRHFLREAIEREPGAVIVGQAENAARALSLARKLRPDVAIIDSCLPHTFGLDAVPLSRIGGLDTALATSEEIPNIRVVLLSNLDTEVLPDHGLSSGSGPIFSREVMGARIPFTIPELCHGAEATDTLVFADIETKPRTSFRKKITSMSDKAIFFGGLGILGGLALMLTVILAGSGIFLALAGVATILLGLAGKLAASLWPGSSRQEGRIKLSVNKSVRPGWQRL